MSLNNVNIDVIILKIFFVLVFLRLGGVFGKRSEVIASANDHRVAQASGSNNAGNEVVLRRGCTA